MRVLMLGWEFPPFISGGLGTACYGLTKAMAQQHVQVLFVLPRPVDAATPSHVKLLTPQPAPASLRYGYAQEAAARLADTREQTFVTQNEPASSMTQQQGQTAEGGRIASGHGKSHGQQMHPWQDQPGRSTPGVTYTLRGVDARLPGAYASGHGYDVNRPRTGPKVVRRIDPQTGRVLYEPEDQHAAWPATGASSWSSSSSGASSVAGGQIASQPLSVLCDGTSHAGGAGQNYQGDIISESRRYAELCVELARQHAFDVIHAHDWMTFPAGMAVAAATGKPLVVHVHSTEFDRSGDCVNQQVYDIERRGMRSACRVIAVSHLTRSIVQHRYGVAADRIDVVYNGIEPPEHGRDVFNSQAAISRKDKIVLFLGRITMQKGPEYFIAAAKKVLEKYEHVKFVVAGTGDKIREIIEMAASEGIGQKVLFTGFLRKADVERVFRMADVYVMPSVSEPFGIAPLEAISHDVPVILSRTSGVSEVLTHVLKVDFWDTHEMANKIIAVLRHPPLSTTLRHHADLEIRRLTWAGAATRCQEVYRHALSMVEA